jgi:hypothetical protein
MNCWVTETGHLEVLPRVTVPIAEVQKIINEFLWTHDKKLLRFCPYKTRTRQALQHHKQLGKGVLYVEMEKVLELTETAVYLVDLTIAYQAWESEKAGKALSAGEQATEWDIYEALCMLVGAGFGYWDYSAA